MPTDIRFFLFDGLKNDVRQMLLTHALYHDPSTSMEMKHYYLILIIIQTD